MKKYNRNVKKCELFAIQTDKGFLFTDANGDFWLGGSPSGIGLAIFFTKDEANAFRRRAKRKRPDLFEWTKIVRCWVVTPTLKQKIMKEMLIKQKAGEKLMRN